MKIIDEIFSRFYREKTINVRCRHCNYKTKIGLHIINYQHDISTICKKCKKTDEFLNLFKVI